jgi:hypothetical protein
VTEGGRSTHLTSLAGKLRRDGATADEILAKLKEENAKNCSPPLGVEEIAKIVASVSQYPHGEIAGADAAETLVERMLDQHFAGGRRLLYTGHQFWHYWKGMWSIVPDAWVSGKVLETLKVHPVKGQKSASLVGQAMMLSKARLTPRDDVLGFVSSPSWAESIGKAAGVSRTGVWVYIAELPPRQMIEWGYILPEPGDGQSWTSALPTRDREFMQAVGC